MLLHGLGMNMADWSRCPSGGKKYQIKGTRSPSEGGLDWVANPGKRPGPADRRLGDTA